jgi:hypothetical protein
VGILGQFEAVGPSTVVSNPVLSCPVLSPSLSTLASLVAPEATHHYTVRYTYLPSPLHSALTTYIHASCPRVALVLACHSPRVCNTHRIRPSCRRSLAVATPDSTKNLPACRIPTRLALAQSRFPRPLLLRRLRLRLRRIALHRIVAGLVASPPPDGRLHRCPCGRLVGEAAARPTLNAKVTPPPSQTLSPSLLAAMPCGTPPNGGAVDGSEKTRARLAPCATSRRARPFCRQPTRPLPLLRKRSSDCAGTALTTKSPPSLTRNASNRARTSAPSHNSTSMPTTSSPLHSRVSRPPVNGDAFNDHSPCAGP